MIEKLPRSTWALLLIGILIRLLAVNQPIIDGMHLRQTQTADATASMLREGGFPLDSEASWRGDLGARVVQEFPIYNHATLLLAYAGVPMVPAGKIVSVIFWILAYLALQMVWRRLLTVAEIFWANMLFVFSPMSVFFGQAFMPESLVLFLTYGFMALWLKHFDTKATWPLLMAGLVALAGLVTKAPAYFYVGVFAACSLAFTSQWKRFLDVRYYLLAAIIIFFVKIWFDFTDAGSSEHFSRWSASSNLPRFIGPLSERFSLAFWFRIFAYNFAMVVTPAAFVISCMALFLKSPSNAPHDRTPLLAAWWASILAFVLMFGTHTASNHSYYNLPMLAPFAALFGISCAKIAFIAKQKLRRPWEIATVSCLCISVIIVPLPVTKHLFSQDIPTYKVALWIRDNTASDELTIVRMTGNPTPDIPTVSFYAERRVWIWSRYLPDYERQRALNTAKFAVHSKPIDRRSSVIKAWHRFRGFKDPLPETDFPPEEFPCEKIFENEYLTAYRRADL